MKNQWKQLQTYARRTDSEWVQFVKSERVWYAALEFAGITPIELRRLVREFSK